MKISKKKGFTILELLVVVAIIAILAMIAIPNFIGRIDEAKASRELAEINAVEKAISTYYADNGVYPTLQGKDGSLLQPQPLDGSPHNIDFSSLVPNYLVSLPHFSYWWVDYKGDVYHTQNVIGSLSGAAFTPTTGYTYTLYKTNGTIQVLSAPYTLLAGEFILGKDEKGSELPKLTSAFKNAKMHPEDPEYVVVPTLPVNTAYTFTNAGATGRTGPIQSQITTAYTGTSLDSKVTSNNGIQLWTVPADGIYRIQAYGAQGGATTSNGGGLGGLGAVITGDVSLTAGTQLKIVVGQQPLQGVYSGGGGGGTYVAKADNTPLIVAGGGAGHSYSDGQGNNAVLTENGGASDSGQAGGTNGSGGFTLAVSTSGEGSAGGGFYGNGASQKHTSSLGTGGLSFTNGSVGGIKWSADRGSDGGFGGGGGCGNHGSGGGGGYSGGGAGKSNGFSGGGGGSYNIGTSPTNIVGNTGNGKVVITYKGL